MEVDCPPAHPRSLEAVLGQLYPAPYGAKVDATIADDEELLAHAACDDVFAGAGAASMGAQADTGRPKWRKR